MNDIRRIKYMVDNCQMLNQRKCEYCRRSQTCKEYQIVKQEKEKANERKEILLD